METTSTGITVGQLRHQLGLYPQDAELIFCGLHFYRLKVRGDKLVQLEFQEHVFRNEDGRVVIVE